MIRKAVFLTLLLCCCNIFGQADWTIFTYIEASEGLQHEAIKNISDMALGNVPENINMIVQLHTKEDISWIYKIDGNAIILLDIVTITENAKNNIVESMTNIVKQFPAKYYGIILWNHGFGILVPTYDPATNTWNVEPDGNNCFGACDLVSVDSDIFLEKKKRRKCEHSYHKGLLNRYHKGLLINDHTKTVMNNYDMVELCKIISENLLKGEKISLLGMDCCLGAMIEHGYQLRNYVDYLVGSQDCELSDGWDYTAMIKHFRNGELSPRTFAQNIVLDYGNYYAPIAPVGRYTQSAIDLNFMEDLTKNIDSVIALLKTCLNEQPDYFKSLIASARNSCIRFCQMPAYTDIDNFYSNLLQYIEAESHDGDFFNIFKQLKQLIDEGKKIIQKTVVANALGPVNKGAQGISIYFPLYHIDTSYYDCIFAQETNWLQFLQRLVE
ncbi:hypothetical protein KAH94_05635 [bacterium]|nr:hypothetical protein [bacterium]